MNAPVSAAAMPRLGASEVRSIVSCWREKELWITALIVLLIYFSRPTALSIRGEESRWANVAREMLQSGDFIVPRQQGDVFANRPPLTNWCIALTMTLTGREDAWTVRLPTLTATLLTTLIIYGFGRVFLSRLGALIAAISYASMWQVLELGRLAETDAIFTLCFTVSLLGWYTSYIQGRSPYLTWLLGYGFAALAGLAKGPQGPIYFVGATWIYLLCFDRPFLRHKAQLAGIALFTSLIAAWQVPLMQAVGFRDSLDIWSSEAGRRLADPGTVVEFATHVASFPKEVVTCMLPWSLLLVGYANSGIRKNLGELKRPAQFLAIASIVGLLPLLATFHARGRYYMPLHPCVAILIAIVVESSLAPSPANRGASIWRCFLLVCGTIIAAGAVAILAGYYGLQWIAPQYVQSTATVVSFTACATLAVVLCGNAFLHCNRRNSAFAACAIACLSGLASTLIAINALVYRSSDPRGDMERLCAQIPSTAELVSFTPIHHLFAYQLSEVSRRSVRRVREPAAAVDPIDWEYFCLNSYEPLSRPLPFRWEQVGVVVVDRHRYAPPKTYVVVGRRLPDGGPP